MFGMVEGRQPGACNSKIADFFGVVVFHHGNPDLSATSKKQKPFSRTQQCSSAPANLSARSIGLWGASSSKRVTV